MRRLLSFIITLTFILSIGGVFAVWTYATNPPPSIDSNLSLTLGSFSYYEPLPEDEVTLIERLGHILNQEYSTDEVIDSRDYLLNETIVVRWEAGAAPYVGSMDLNYATQIHNLFGDVIDDTSVSFILKNQDLNWDGFSEIALYSTSDPLDCVEEFDGVVKVHVSVYVPILDENFNLLYYELACDSLTGFCSEVFYSQEDKNPSFSTDEWKNDIGYWDWPDQRPIPDSAMSNDGTKPYKQDYESYNVYYNYEGAPWPARTCPYGKTLLECIWDKIPYYDIWS